MTTNVRAFVELERQAAKEMGRKFRVKRPTIQRFPLAAERGYVSALLKIVKAIRDDINAELVPQLGWISRQSGLRDDSEHLDIADVEAVIKGIEENITARIDNSHLRGLEELVQKYRDQATSFSRDQTIRQIRRMIGIDAFPIETGLQTQLDVFLSNNVQLIKSLTGDYEDKVMASVRRHVQAGDRPGLIEEDLRAEFGKAANRAKLIARDQTNKLNGNLTEMRQTSLGLEEYYWRTSRDERVRPSHLAKEGLVFRWDDPPADTGHPGNDILCRCDAEPKIPGEPEDTEDRKAVIAEVKAKQAALKEQAKLKKAKPKVKKVTEKTKLKKVTKKKAPAKAKPKVEPLDSPFGQIRGKRPDHPLDGPEYDAVDAWVNADKQAAILKLGAKEEFGLAGVPFTRKISPIARKDIASAGKIARRMYEKTQAELKKAGIKKVKVYRGTVKKPAHVSALESWSDKRSSAEKFLGDEGELLIQEVPAERILNGHKMPHWHHGESGQEFEWIVMT